jgi:hypothetical protein
LAGAFAINEPEFVAEAGPRDVVTFAGIVDGHGVGLLAILTHGDRGEYRAVDMYARPWPFVALARQRAVAADVLFTTDIDLSTAYVPSGPTGEFLDPQPALPGLAEDVAFHSPVLTATASGLHLVKTVLSAVEEVCGPAQYRIFLPTADSIVVAYDAEVHGHQWQLTAVFALNAQGQIADMRIYSRPWPVTALFRGEVYKLLQDTLGPQFWQGQNPLIALGER